jgi:hypothetical protein
VRRVTLAGELAHARQHEAHFIRDDVTPAIAPAFFCIDRAAGSCALAILVRTDGPDLEEGEHLAPGLVALAQPLRMVALPLFALAARFRALLCGGAGRVLGGQGACVSWSGGVVCWCSSGTLRPSRGAGLRPSSSPYSAPSRGGGAPRGAVSQPRLPARRPLRKDVSPLGAPLRRFRIPGPRFQETPRSSFAFPSAQAPRLDAGGACEGAPRRPVQRAPRGGVVVPPGRVPGPPECVAANHARGRRPLLRLQNASGRRPSMSKVTGL